MPKFKFDFYKDGKKKSTITFDAEFIEDAYQQADNLLNLTDRYDDWSCVRSVFKNNDDGNEEITEISITGRVGTQRSPFGPGS